jgi:hypothetical protein
MYIWHDLGMTIGYNTYMAAWWSLRSFGKLIRFWYFWTKKNLATLIEEREDKQRLW